MTLKALLLYLTMKNYHDTEKATLLCMQGSASSTGQTPETSASILDWNLVSFSFSFSELMLFLFVKIFFS